MKSPVIGILALQGGFAKHAEALQSLGVTPVFVRYPHELAQCDALIIPGGESTTISRSIDFIGLRAPLIEFSLKKPVFGTCAGLIMLSKGAQDSKVETFGIMDVEVMRNGYGAQYESFSAEVDLTIDQKKKPFHAVFIRGPRINTIGPEVKILATFQNEPILIQQGNCLAATFHPELTQDSRIHRYFLNLIRP